MTPPGSASNIGSRRALPPTLEGPACSDGGPQRYRQEGPLLEIEAGGQWLGTKDASEIENAEGVLCAGLAKDTDGYLARFDRKLSIRLSRLLLRTPVTPNHITTASLFLGLLGAWELASGTRLTQFAGAVVLWFCCILDGCDGEVAHLKLLSTPSGAAYDLWADEIAHIATAAAIPFGVHRMFPQERFAVPGTLLVSGFIACGYFMWRLVLSRPEAERGPHVVIIERIASRDYVYLIVLLTALGRLDWFLWAAGFGTHLFWLGLLWLCRGDRLGQETVLTSSP